MSVEHRYTNWTLSATGARSGSQEWRVQVYHNRFLVPFRYLVILSVNGFRAELRVIPYEGNPPEMREGLLRLHGEHAEWVEMAHSVMRLIDAAAFAIFYRTCVDHHKVRDFRWLHDLIIQEFEK
jgi:hypothetical protein